MPLNLFFVIFALLFSSKVAQAADGSAGSVDSGSGAVLTNIGDSFFARREEGISFSDRDKNKKKSKLFSYDSQDYHKNPDRLKQFDGKFALQKVTFHGAEMISEAELQAIASAYVNREVSFKDLADLKRAVYDYYTKKGYLFHRILLPSQVVRDGTVDIYVRETNISRIILSASKKVRKSLAPYIAKLRKARKKCDYERQLKLMQKLPGYKVVAVVRPMKDQPTHLEMHVIVEEDRFHAALSFGNTQLKKEVGPWALGGSLNFDNILGLNEHFEVDGRIVHPYRELTAISTALMLPVGTAGLRLLGGWSGSKSEQSIIPPSGPAIASGIVYSRHRFKAGISYDILLDSKKEITGEFGYYWFRSGQENYGPVPHSERKTPRIKQDVDYDWMRFKLRAKHRCGSISQVFLLSASIQPKRKDADVYYSRGGGSALKKSRASDIKMARALYGMYTFYALLKRNIGISLIVDGQLSFDQRQGSDFFRPVGDLRTTLAYPMGTIGGGSGWSSRLSISKVIPASKMFILAPYVFGSYGAAASHLGAKEMHYVDLWSWGLGVDMSVARALSLKVEFAQPMGHVRKLPKDYRKIVGERRFIFTAAVTC